MEPKNYCIVNQSSGICENIVLWDGRIETWTPPDGYLALERDKVPVKKWFWKTDIKDWVLETAMGEGSIGFTWDGDHLHTNEPKPNPVIDPQSELEAVVQAMVEQRLAQLQSTDTSSQ